MKRKVVLEKSTGVTKEGDLMQGSVANIDASGVDDQKVSKVTIEATNTTMRFYGAKNPGDGNGGGMFIDVQAGQSVTKSAKEFGMQTGLGMQGNFLNVQNVGGMMGHWKITIA